MPLQRCKSGGVSGWRWGDAGKCYTGKDAKKRAIKQGIAVEGPDQFRAEAEADAVIEVMLLDGSRAFDYSFDNEFFDALHAHVSQKERDQIPAADFGWPEERKYPIRDQADLDAAAKLIGRAPKDKQEGIKSRIKKIAKRKGLKLPDSWES